MPIGVTRHNIITTPQTPRSAASFSLTQKNANVTLLISRTRMTTFGASNNQYAVRGDDLTAAITSGQKRYFEGKADATCGVSTAEQIGVCNASQTFADGNFIGSSANGIGFSTDTNVYVNSVAVHTLAAYVAGNTVCVAVTGATKIWFRINGGNWNNDILANQNPALNVGGFTDISTMGTVYPACDTFKATSAPFLTTMWTFNFGPTFSFLVPDGFSGFP